jgi:hypothetical protein
MRVNDRVLSSPALDYSMHNKWTARVVLFDDTNEKGEEQRTASP